MGLQETMSFGFQYLGRFIDTPVNESTQFKEYTLVFICVHRAITHTSNDYV